MFMEKILALMGDVPVQFYPVCYAFGFIAFLWIVDKLNLGIVMKVVEWMFHELSLLFDILWRHSYWVGMFVIGLPLLKKVVDIFRRLL